MSDPAATYKRELYAHHWQWLLIMASIFTCFFNTIFQIKIMCVKALYVASYFQSYTASNVKLRGGSVLELFGLCMVIHPLLTSMSTILIKKKIVNYYQLNKRPMGSPELQFLVTFYLVAYAISILNLKPLSGALISVQGLWLALKI